MRSSERKMGLRIVRPATKQSVLAKNTGAKQPIHTVPDATHFLGVKEAILVEVDESLCLLLESRGQAVSVRLVVLEFRVDKVVDLEHGG
jgi:hypothetical protein